MKIIYLHQYFNTPAMVGGTRSYEMARRMVAEGHEVHMVTSYRDREVNSSGWSITEEEGIHVHWYPVPYSNHMGFFRRLKAFLAFAFAAKKRVAQLDGDLVFATSTPLTIALPAVPAARKKNIPLVFEVRDLWPEMPIAMGALKNPFFRFAARKLERWAYYNSSAVIALSPEMKAGIEATGYPAEKIAIIPNSSDNKEFAHSPHAAQVFRSKRPWIGERPLLVYAGTFGKVNGVSYLVDLAKELQSLSSDICILLVGQGAEYGSIVDAAKKAGVYGINVFIEEPLPKREIPGLLSATTISASLFIDLPEMRANSANKFFDALAAGTPVLLNYGGWMHDLVNDHGCGLALWRRSLPEVAAELENRIHDSCWLQQAGSAARKLAEECFARDDLAHQLITVLHAVLRGCPEKAEKIAPGVYDKKYETNNG